MSYLITTSVICACLVPVANARELHKGSGTAGLHRQPSMYATSIFLSFGMFPAHLLVPFSIQDAAWNVKKRRVIRRPCNLENLAASVLTKAGGVSCRRLGEGSQGFKAATRRNGQQQFWNSFFPGAEALGRCCRLCGGPCMATCAAAAYARSDLFKRRSLPRSGFAAPRNSFSTFRRRSICP